MDRLLRPVMSSTSCRPADTASSTTYWMAGLSTTGSISLGVALVAGRNRVPSPAAGMTALVTVLVLADSAMARTVAVVLGHSLPGSGPGRDTVASWRRLSFAPGSALP